MPRGASALAPHAAVLRVRAIRDASLVGLLSRVPQFGLGVLLTLHIVQHLDPRYSRAGLVSGVYVVAVTIAGPWRGHLLDRRGLRRTMLPSVVVQAVCLAVAPLCGYWLLLTVMVPLGLMCPPTFSALRQVMVTTAPDELRSTAMSMDAVAVEVAYMSGPTLAVWAVTAMDTRTALWLFGGTWLLGSVLLTVLDPPIQPEGAGAVESGTLPASEQAGLDLAARADAATGRPGGWLTSGIVALLVALAGAGFVLGATELTTVAALRSLGRPGQIGWQLAIWGGGSAIGGILAGTLRRQLPVFALLGGLGLTAIPLGWAHHSLAFALLLLVNGLFCAPTLATSADVLSRQVDARFLGQAMGWHGSAVNAGTALAPTVVGSLVDTAGWASGYWATGAIGVVAASVLVAGQALRRRGGAGRRPETKME